MSRKRNYIVRYHHYADPKGVFREQAFGGHEPAILFFVALDDDALPIMYRKHGDR